MRHVIQFTCCLALIIILMFCKASADNTGNSKGEFGMKFGYFGAGTLNIKNKNSSGSGIFGAISRGYEVDTRSDICVGMYFDYRISQPLYTGLTVDLAKIHITDSNEELLIIIGTVLKADIKSGSKGFSMRPGIGLGYGFMSEIMGLESSRYLIIRANYELLYPVGRTIGIINELGFFWGVSGGNDNYNITGGPFLMFRTGLYFF